MDDISERIDEICTEITNPIALNALHACRPGHPWNKDNKWCWRNAHVLILQLQPSSSLYVATRHLDWVDKMARDEAAANP